MKSRSLVLVCLAACVLLVACKEDSQAQPDAMPAGYERIDAAFGVRSTGITSENGVTSGPVVEFRANGDYNLYPFTTDCAGQFMKGAGIVFAPDGTVREQSAPLDRSDLSANPQYRPLVDKLCPVASKAPQQQALPEATATDAAVALDGAATDAVDAATSDAEASIDPAAMVEADIIAAREEARQARAEAAAARAEAQATRDEAEQARIDQQQMQALPTQQQEQCPYSRSQPLSCSSRQGQPAYCDWDFKACGNPRMSKKESKTTCEGRMSTDTVNNQIIVVEGCRAQFIPQQ